MAELTQQKLTQILYNAYYHQVKDKPEHRGIQPWISVDGAIKASWSAIAAEVLREMKAVREIDD